MVSDLLHPIFSRRTLCTADKLSERALHYHLQGILCLDRVAENKSRQRTTPMEQRKENRKKRTRPARDIQGDAGRLKRYPFTCFPLSRNLYSFRVRLVAMRYAPSRISGTLSHCPMLKVISASSATCGFFINSSKASAKEYKQAYSGY